MYDFPMRDPTILSEKRALRGLMRERLAGLTADAHEEAGHALARALSPLVDVLPEGAVALFATRPHEIATAPLDGLLRAHERTRLLPAIVDGDLVFRALPPSVSFQALAVDALGIATPGPDFPTMPLDCAVLVFVPGSAFDDDGARLGWGKGYYDRALARLPQTVPTVGLLHDEQRVARVPHDAHDIPIAVTCSPSSIRVHRPLPAPIQSAIHAGFARRGETR